MWDLREVDVDELVFESREPHNDLKDRRTLLQAQQAQAAPKVRGYSFSWPHDEPLLWLPDAAAGAITLQAAEGVTRYVEVLGDRLTVTAVNL